MFEKSASLRDPVNMPQKATEGFSVDWDEII